MKDLKHFRFWCYKVLPLVYDNSLSYYEVLCKIRDYINNIIDNMTELADALEALEGRVKKNEDDIADIKAQLEDISQLIINEVKRYLQTPEFIQELIDALEGDEDFTKFLTDTITNNEDFYKNLITNDYFEEYLADHADVLTNVLAQKTDFYDEISITNDDMQTKLATAGLTSSAFALVNGLTIGNVYRAMIDASYTYIAGRAVQSETGGIYTIAVDATATGWHTFIINKDGYTNKNIAFKLGTPCSNIEYYNIKKGSIATGGQSVQTAIEPDSYSDTTAYPANHYFVPTKKNNANVLVISFQETTTGTAPTTKALRVLKGFKWDGLTNTFVVLPFNTQVILNDDLTFSLTSLDVFIPKNDLAKTILGLLQYNAEASNVSIDALSVEVSGEIDDLKKSVSDGKTLVAGAITQKGVATSGSDTFAQMAENILAIPTGDNYFKVKNFEVTGLNADTLTIPGWHEIDIEHEPTYDDIAQIIGINHSGNVYYMGDTYLNTGILISDAAYAYSNGAYTTVKAFVGSARPKAYIKNENYITYFESYSGTYYPVYTMYKKFYKGNSSIEKWGYILYTGDSSYSTYNHVIFDENLAPRWDCQGATNIYRQINIDENTTNDMLLVPLETTDYYIAKNVYVGNAKPQNFTKSLRVTAYKDIENNQYLSTYANSVSGKHDIILPL